MRRAASAGRSSPFLNRSGISRKGVLTEETKADGSVSIRWKPTPAAASSAASATAASSGGGSVAPNATGASPATMKEKAASAANKKFVRGGGGVPAVASRESAASTSPKEAAATQEKLTVDALLADLFPAPSVFSDDTHAPQQQQQRLHLPVRGSHDLGRSSFAAAGDTLGSILGTGGSLNPSTSMSKAALLRQVLEQDPASLRRQLLKGRKGSQSVDTLLLRKSGGRGKSPSQAVGVSVRPGASAAGTPTATATSTPHDLPEQTQSFLRDSSSVAAGSVSRPSAAVSSNASASSCPTPTTATAAAKPTRGHQTETAASPSVRISSRKSFDDSVAGVSSRRTTAVSGSMQSGGSASSRPSRVRYVQADRDSFSQASEPSRSSPTTGGQRQPVHGTKNSVGHQSQAQQQQLSQSSPKWTTEELDPAAELGSLEERSDLARSFFQWRLAQLHRKIAAKSSEHDSKAKITITSTPGRGSRQGEFSSVQDDEVGEQHQLQEAMKAKLAALTLENAELQKGLQVAGKFVRDLREKEDVQLKQVCFLTWARVCAVDTRELAAEIKAQCLEEYAGRETALRERLRGRTQELIANVMRRRGLREGLRGWRKAVAVLGKERAEQELTLTDAPVLRELAALRDGEAEADAELGESSSSEPQRRELLQERRLEQKREKQQLLVRDIADSKASGKQGRLFLTAPAATSAPEASSSITSFSAAVRGPAVVSAASPASTAASRSPSGARRTPKSFPEKHFSSSSSSSTPKGTSASRGASFARELVLEKELVALRQELLEADTLLKKAKDESGLLLREKDRQLEELLSEKINLEKERLQLALSSEKEQGAGQEDFAEMNKLNDSVVLDEKLRAAEEDLARYREQWETSEDKRGILEKELAAKGEEVGLLEKKIEVLAEGRKADKEKIRKGVLLDNDRRRTIEKLKEACAEGEKLKEEQEKLAEEREGIARKKSQLSSQGKALEQMQKRLDTCMSDLEDQKQTFVSKEKARLTLAYGDALSKAGDLGHRWRRIRSCLQTLYAWKTCASESRHEKHQRELQEEFDACTREWDDQVAEKLREQKASYENARQIDRERMQRRLDDMHKEVAESRRVFTENSELKHSVVAARTSLTIFRDLMKQQMCALDEKLLEKLASSEQKLCRVAVSVQSFLLEKKEQEANKLRSVEDVQLGDLYRELKSTYGRLLSAHASKKRELNLCKDELKRLTKRRRGSSGGAGNQSVLMMQANMVRSSSDLLNSSALSAGSRSGGGLTPGGCAGSNTPGQGTPGAAGGGGQMCVSFVGGGGQGARLQSLEQQVATLQQERGKCLQDAAAVEQKNADLCKEITAQKRILFNQNRAVYRIRKRAEKLDIFVKWRRLACSSRDVRVVVKSPPAANNKKQPRDQEDDLAETSTKETVLSGGVGGAGRGSSGSGSTSSSADEGTKEAGTKEGGPSAMSTTSPSKRFALQSLSDARREKMRGGAMEVAKKAVKSVPCPSVLLRALRQANGQTEMEVVRFCFFVWIFDIRERKFEKALKQTSRQLTKENDQLQERCLHAEAELQNALLSKMHQTEEVANLAKALENSTGKEIQARQEAEKWKLQHGLMTEEVRSLQSLRPQSPKILHIEEL